MSDFIFSVEPLKCLRRDYANNDCSICINLCPEKAITFKRGKIGIDKSLCTACHGCVGVCPTEAIESTKFEPNFFVAKEISLEKNELKQKLLSDTLRLSCKEMGVCLCVFDKSHIIALGMKSNRKIEADISLCQECELNRNNKLKSAIDGMLDEANGFLAEFANKHIEAKIERSGDRRNFLKTLFKRTVSAAESLDEPSAAIEKPKTKLPLKRILLKNAVKDTLDDTNRFVKNDYSFSISKSISKECTNCKSCVEFCPTNALFYSSDFSKIYFQSGKCIDCNICNDICAPKAFVDSFEKDIANFAFDKAIVAIEHNLIVCKSCKMAFSSKEGEETCPKCEEYKNDFSYMFMTAAEIEEAEKKS
jgi:energy-converting hydrogenase A subunit P